MKITSVFFLLFLLAACTAEELTSAQQEFKKTCTENDDPFMLMSETKDGQVIGPACYGCMPDERNHVCSQEEYLRLK